MSVPGGARQARLCLGAGEFARLAKLVRAEGGISLPATKAEMVRARLAPRLRALGLPSFVSYTDLVEGAGNAAAREREEMVSALTVNVTRFFREPHHFDTMRKEILPELAMRARAGARVRFWSAGCSTGEEPYSLALTVLDALPEAPSLDVRILATDLDRRVLAAGKAGIYPDKATRWIPAPLRARYFQQVTGGREVRFCAGPALRALVAFRQLNLARPWPMRGPFDAIFCRNVVIYFDSATETNVWRRFGDRMPKGARLFIGHSERINTSVLPMFKGDGITTYCRL